MEKPNLRGKLKTITENDIIRRREKQFNYDRMWNGAVRYFDHWDRANKQYDAWTSPRYYEDNNKLVTETRSKRDKEELLEKRREKLKKLLDEERSSFEIELMVQKNKHIQKPFMDNSDDTPTAVLKDINDNLKLKEQERKRHEAELKLYHQWRINNPIVRQYENKYRCRDLKLSWLDQQIQKRMQKEKEEEEMEKFLEDRKERLKVALEKEERFKKYLEDKRMQLRKNLDEQMKELREKQDISNKLRIEEAAEVKRKCQLAEIEDMYKIEEKRRAERECALYNIRQHKLKLKQKACDIKENLEQEKYILKKLKQLELEDVIADEFKKNEIRVGLAEFLDILKQQQELERQRQKHLEFLFESEVKAVYEKQSEMWRREELARQNLVKQVLKTVQNQIEDNINKNKEKQKQVVLEREEMTKKVEEYNRELHELQDEEERKKKEMKEMLDEDVKMKSVRKKHEENIQLKEINEELDRIKKEEDRLQKEILKMQQKRGPISPPRDSRIFF